MTFKKCRNDGCEVLIEVRQTPEGWRPFEESGSKHNCQFSDYAKKQKAQDKNDHGKELEQDTTTSLGGEYVDHTLKGQSKVKIFFSTYAPDVEKEYNDFCATHPKTQGAHDHVTRTIKEDDEGEMLFTIFLYYEEVAK